MQIGTVSRHWLRGRSWRTPKSTSGGSSRVFGSHTFAPISWMFVKQTAVSRSSTESEIIYLDAGLRMDGLPALDLWDLIVVGKISDAKEILWIIDDLNNVDFVSSNVNSSHKEALLKIVEDNEAVIKMIIKGRSPTMRHVSRTRRVALDWLFDGPKNPNRHQKPTRRHPDQRELHTWWVESFAELV